MHLIFFIGFNKNKHYNFNLQERPPSYQSAYVYVSILSIEVNICTYTEILT